MLPRKGPLGPFLPFPDPGCKMQTTPVNISIRSSRFQSTRMDGPSSDGWE